MKKLFLIALMILFSLHSLFGQEKNIKVSLLLTQPLIPDKDSGVIVDLLKLMGEEYKAGKIEITGAFPMARSINNVISGEANVHIPILKGDVIGNNLPYIYSTSTLWAQPFVIYANKNVKGLSADTINKFRILGDRGHNNSFNFKCDPVDNPESALKMVDAGRYDAYIGPMPPSDGALKSLGFRNIKRIYYKSYPTKMLFANTAEGRAMDKIFTELIEKLRKKGKYQKILANPIIATGIDYVEWQP